MGKSISFLLLVAALAISSAGAQSLPDIEEVVRKLDGLYRGKSCCAEITMEIVTPRRRRTLEMKAWTADPGKCFIRVTGPVTERGIAALRVGGEAWSYLPNVDTTVKLSPAMMADPWMGSDFTGGDLLGASSLAADYNYRYVPPESPGDDLLYLQFTSKADKPTVWFRIIETVRRSDCLPVRARYYDEHGTVVRELRFNDIREFKGRPLPAAIESLPGDRPGCKTVIRYRELEPEAPVDASIFTQRNLRRE